MSARGGESDELLRTRRAQRDAADPAASAWVSANAGTGKTHVLTQRVLRLMLAGTVPERILCLTYTKAAAAEMSQRVFDTLAGWVTMPEEDLRDALTDLNDRAPTADELAHARTLFAVAIETPGGLKVQTIHSFCERLLQRFPLEADVAPAFAILDDASALLLQREAIDVALRQATADPDSPCGRALKAAIPYAADDRFEEILRTAMQRRRWLESAVRLNDDDADELAAVAELYRGAFGIDPDRTLEAIEDDLATVLSDEVLAEARDALSAGTATDQKAAAALAPALAAGSAPLRIAALSRFFCTKDGDPRARLATAQIATAHQGLVTLLAEARGRFVALLQERKGFQALAATLALHRLAGVVIQHYADAKRSRAALDYEDLIARTASLLRDVRSAAWVLFKLDRGIDHILVDEAQDTSPEQWQIIEALAQEFFSGRGQREDARTLFAVGDEKQSIYSFQGADPRKFAQMGRMFADLGRSAGQALRAIPLDLSFRSVAPVLASVDRVFSDPQRTPGLSAEEAIVRHAVHRLGHGGLVELWPTETADDDPQADAWAPLDEEAVGAPAARLAARIADTIAGWLAQGEVLASEGRPVRPGDILILVRKRRPFAATMVAALKARRVPVAGADRLRLSDQIAVADLVSLGEFLTLPEDDLSLAEVLKSPLIGLDDDDLLAIAHDRKGRTLWKALLEAAAGNPRLAAAAETLKRWRARADFAPPFEFFASILDRDGARARFLARLGPEAADPLDELLNLALSFDDANPPSLTAFLAFLRETEREVKRDMEHGRNEVRVMTVHGAKGLEAPIVFLPDTCSTATGGPVSTLYDLSALPLPDGVEGTPFVWSVKGTGSHPLIAAARGERQDLETEERNRLLYVAMTRARDRLYVAGFEGKRGRTTGCWYEIVEATLRPVMSEADGPEDAKVLRLAADQTVQPAKARLEHAEAGAAVPLPDWALRAAPREPSLAVPLAPSRLEAYVADAEGEPQPEPHRLRTGDEPAALAPGAANRFLRGTLTHALLQHLPELPPPRWKEAAREFVRRRGAALADRVQAEIVTETLAILAAPQFAPLFGRGSRAEVPIVALIANPRPSAPPLKLIGQIDRLVDLGHKLMIVDYKTNRPPPKDVERVAAAYLYQLAAYRLALAEIYPGRAVEAALLWTEAPRIMQVPRGLLDDYASRLWDLDLGQLDARGGRS